MGGMTASRAPLGRALAVALALAIAAGCIGRGSQGAAPTPTARAVTPPPRDRPADAGRMEAPQPPPEAPPEAAVGAAGPISGVGERTLPGEVAAGSLWQDHPVELDAGDVLEASLTTSAGLDLLLLDGRGAELGSSRLGPSSVDRLEHAAGGRCQAVLRVAASAPLSAQARYTLQVRIRRQDDAGSGGDEPADGGLELGPGNVTGFVGDADAADGYLVPLGAGDVLAARLVPASGADLDLSLDGPDGAELRAPRLGAGLAEEVEYASGTAVRYRLTVSAGRGAVARGSYALGISLRRPDDASSGRDAGEAPTDALPGRAGALRGWVGDGYAFALRRGQVLIAELAPPLRLDLDLAVRDAEGRELASSRGGVGRPEVARWRAWADANVTVLVDCRKDCRANRGPYELTVVVS